LSPEAAQKVLHELRVHQIELELQNDELRRTQLELEESRSRYFELYDLAPVGYVTLSEEGLIERANLTVAGLLGVARGALVKAPWTRFIFPEDQDVYFKHRKLLYSTGAPRGCELRLLRSNGEVFWVRLDARVAEAHDGARVSRTVVSDITERKRADETLKASEARHRTLFEHSADALMTLVPGQWRLSSGNAATRALFGARAEADLNAHTLWDFSPELQPDGRLSREKGPAMLALALERGTHAFEWTFLRASKEEFRASIALTRMMADGALLLQATVRDESEAEQRRALLAQTERLANMGFLAASVGHEINNPLAYVLSHVEGLAEILPKVASAVERCQGVLRGAIGSDGYTAALGEHAEVIEAATLQGATEQATEALSGARRIATISKVLSTFSRVGAEAMSVVDLQYAIECAIALAFNQIRFRAKLVTVFAPLLEVSAPEGKLSQVFLNLLVNAAHSIGEGQVESNCITVRTWAEGANVFGEVHDTGAGMSATTQRQIFEPFFTTKPLGMGSGLGLAICKNIVAECRGDIHVESELGRGTRFVVRLPAASEAPAAIDLPDAPAPFVRGRVLVVDDEPLLLKLMKRFLVGHDVVTACSGREAQQVLEVDEDFDLILCDLMMPDQTGVEVHQWLVARNPRLAARLVFTTGGAFGDAAIQYLTDCGATKLEKPFDTVAFKRLVSDRIQWVRNGSARPVTQRLEGV
jgi:PAS domain S-box-containing protein